MNSHPCPDWRRPLRTLAFALLAFTVVPTQAAIVALDHIVAVVNNEVITRNELDRRYHEVVRNLARQDTPIPPRAVLEKQLLERIVTELALQQHARSTGVRVDPVQVERALQSVAAQNNLDLPGLATALARQGQSIESLRTTIRNEMLVSRARERDVDSRLTVTDAEIEGYLQTQAQQGVETEYNFSHILIAVPESAAPETVQAARARAEDIRTRLDQGDDFAELSASYSDAPNALQGGAFGWREAGKIPTLFADALQPLRAGQLAPVLKSGAGFHILRLHDRRGLDSTLEVSQTRVRHILIRTNELTSATDARNRLLQLKERIENQGKFDELARLHSEDASASRGGDLGWLNPGDTVPDFEKAMNALKPGQVSEPVQSPFGWHLIQVLERRDQDVTQERQRLARTQGRGSLPGLGAPDP